MTEFSDLIAQPGERHLIYGGTRAGKSSFIDWQIREIQKTRPDCMQILVDSKPRFRAETERGAFGPKAEEPPRGGISTGARVRQYLIPFSLIFTPTTLFVGFGKDQEKWQSCSQVMKTIGDECSFSYRILYVRRSETESATFMPMKYLTSTDGQHTAS